MLIRAVALLWAFAQAALTAAGPWIGTATTPWGMDLSGRPVAQLAPPGTPAVVLFFIATDCPLANRYVPEIEHMAQTHPQVSFRFVYPAAPETGGTAAAVQTHRAQYRITSQAILDTRHTLTRLAGATVTPEAAVLVPEGAHLRVAYRGRIDDRYASLGRERPRATHHDLEEALDAVLAGLPAPAPGGPPVGCAIAP